MMDFIYAKEKIYSQDEQGNILAEVDIPIRDENRIDIKHVFVDESLRGQGIASQLMKLAYDHIKGQNKMIVAKCPYAIAWFRKYPEYQDIVINVKTKKTDE